MDAHRGDAQELECKTPGTWSVTLCDPAAAHLQEPLHVLQVEGLMFDDDGRCDRCGPLLAEVIECTPIGELSVDPMKTVFCDPAFS